jgi:hypothetical protein
MADDSENQEKIQKSIAHRVNDGNQEGLSKEIAATTSLPSVAIPGQGENSTEEMLKMLREKLYQIRAKCQNIRKSVLDLKDILSKCSRLDESNATDISEFNAVFNREEKNINHWLNFLEKHMEKGSELNDYADHIEHIDSCWHRVLDNRPDFSQPVCSIKDALEKSDKLLCKIISMCELVTVPDRVNDHLISLRIGQKLDFYKTFEDEICSKTDSKNILEYLSAHPKLIHGIVDAENGVVYSASKDKDRQWRSYIAPLAMMVIGGLVLYVIAPWIISQVPEFLKPEISVWSFVSLYIVIMLGGCFHIAVGIIKEIQSTSNKARISFTDWFLWGHINETSLWTGVIMLWVGFAGLISLKQIDWISGFAVGYSIDSVYSVFMTRFDKTISTRVETVKKSAEA